MRPIRAYAQLASNSGLEGLKAWAEEMKNPPSETPDLW